MARKTLTITIDLESAALADEFGDIEARDIIRQAAVKVERLARGGTWVVDEFNGIPLIDANGVRVGTMVLTEA